MKLTPAELTYVRGTGLYVTEKRPLQKAAEPNPPLHLAATAHGLEWKVVQPLEANHHLEGSHQGLAPRGAAHDTMWRVSDHQRCSLGGKRNGHRHKVTRAARSETSFPR